MLAHQRNVPHAVFTAVQASGAVAVNQVQCQLTIEILVAWLGRLADLVLLHFSL